MMMVFRGQAFSPLFIIGWMLLLLPPPSTSSFVLPTTTTTTTTTRKSNHHNDKKIFLGQEQKTCLWGESSSPQQEESGAARVRFSGSDNKGGMSASTNPLDQFLSFMSSDIVSIVLGSMGLLVVVINRLTTQEEVLDALALETRTDLLAVLACGSVLLNGISKLDVTTAMAETVPLEGNRLPNPEIFLDDTTTTNQQQYTPTLSWGLDSILTATTVKTAIVLQKQIEESSWKIVARAGMVPSSMSAGSILPHTTTTPILDRVGSPGNIKETYLPTLQALPGKREFPYLPANTQLALLIPFGNTDVLVLGGNTAKSLTPRDIAWCRIIAEQMGKDL